MATMRSGLLCASALASLLAFQAAPAAAQAPDSEVSEIVVTGTRIARKDYVSESPIVTVGADQIAVVGMVTIENTLNQLPQFTPSNGAGTNTTNFVTTPGQAYANLRGLGPTRTLVLIDGRRVVAGNPNAVVDLNTVPTFLVESVETITGGASAVYGSDAIAGVVNFKLKRNFEGFQVDAQFGAASRNDAGQTTVSAGWGHSIADGRGNVAMALTYDKREGLLAADRDWAAVGYSILTTGLTPSGAATIPDGRFDPTSNAGGAANLPSQAAMNAVFGAYGFAPGTVARGASLSFNADGTLFSTAPVNNYKGARDPGFSATSYTFNSAAYRYLNLPLERWSLYATGRYDLSDAVEAYGTASYTTYDVSRQLGPASASDGAFPGPDIVVPVTNPYIPTDLRTLLASRANPTADFYPRRAFTEVGGRLSNNTYETLQLVGGLRGALLIKDWKWDLYASYGQMDHTERQFGNVSRAAMRTLTFAADGGAALCGGFNIFGAGKVSPGCAAYIAREVTNSTTIKQTVVEGYATGSLVDLPAGALKFSAGAQYRKDDFDYAPDALLQGPDIVGFNPAVPVSGDITSKEVYAELLVPILADLPLVESLDLTLGGRVADYSTTGQVSAYKADLTWKPVPSLLVRGGYQRAVRAPNIAELFSPRSLGFAGVGTPGAGTTAGDPCDVRSSFRTGASAVAVRTLCLAQGVPTAIIDSFNQASTQVEITGGGNPNLTEETADSVTAGVVWSPAVDARFLRRFSVSLDYYKIEAADVVGTIGVPTILSSCFNADGSNPALTNANFYCQQFSRLASGNITGVSQTQVNLASVKTTGLDAQVDWSFDLADLGLPQDAGALAFNLMVSRLDSFRRQARPNAAFVDFAGTIGADLSGGALPEWKSVLSGSWTVGPVKATLRWRHMAAMTDARSVPTFSPTAVNTPGYDVYDLSGAWKIDDRVTLRAGINNLEDKDPPYFTSYSNSNTDPSAFDILGRRVFVGINARF
ncbi:TonB-dependent receptor domain-containing protein [Phenylobacterium sp.]|uniref:TonB-dependent receptor domain-containing protein n=1 Tax=Phenylobacterium sp. TaxID=1871053 RepID=UPI002728780B|nr:TonB-dependent receptor [Phenylobacterium sp.]MDO8379226.1 TonB-dependent receptor [Phenylobacterium sp.]